MIALLFTVFSLVGFAAADGSSTLEESPALDCSITLSPQARFDAVRHTLGGAAEYFCYAGSSELIVFPGDRVVGLINGRYLELNIPRQSEPGLTHWSAPDEGFNLEIDAESRWVVHGRLNKQPLECLPNPKIRR